VSRRKQKKRPPPAASKPGTGTCVRAVWKDEPAWSAVVDDDGARVACAYLLKEGAIVADVWLYNRGANPTKPEWGIQGARPPFKNPADLVVGSFAPINGPGDVRLEFSRTPAGLVAVDVLLRGKLHARLVEGETPGRCALAKADGPIARVLQV
jgi:hypothetical protein